MNEYVFDAIYSRMYSPRMSADKTIGDRLDEAMKSAKFKSQKALERESHVPQATISRILKGGGKKGPETETIKKLAEACGVNFLWLNEGVGPKFRGDKTLDSDKSNLAPVQSIQRAEYDINGKELMEWIELYRTSTPKERKSILKAAKLVREARVRTQRNPGPTSD